MKASGLAKPPLPTPSPDLEDLGHRHAQAAAHSTPILDWKRTEAGDFAVRLRSGAEVAMSRIHRNAFERAMRSAT